MTLTRDLVDFLLETPEVQQLVADGVIGSSPSYERGYIFEGKPYAPVDNLSFSSTVVIYSKRSWSPPLRGNSLEFPLVEIEIWAAPTKNSDGSQAEYDADDVIELVFKAIKPYVHLVHRSPENGAYFQWGSSKIVSSEILDGPVIRKVINGNGAHVAGIGVGVQK